MKPLVETYLRSQPEAEARPPVICETDHARATELLETARRDRIFNPDENPAATAELLDLRRSWGDSTHPDNDWPATTVFVTGVYDNLHLDHVGYLTHCKLQGVPTHFDRHYAEQAGRSWHELDRDTRKEWEAELLTNGEVRLVTGIRGNTSTALIKGFKPEKGAVTRPIFDWDTRALTVAGITLRSPEGHHTPLVDAVTIYDPIEFPKETDVHHHWLELAAGLRPDVWAFYHESEDIRERGPSDPRLSETAFRLIDEGHYYHDRLVGVFTTTNVVKRLTSHPVGS